ncbi:MAG: hypothetical protein WAU11_14720 [Ignavibacteriaceae bacterium]
MASNKIDYDFYIKIDFEKSSRDPSRIFSTMSSLIETFQAIDSEFAKSIDSKINSVLLLEDVESGSLKSFFKSFLESVDDNALKAGDWKKIVGAYLLKVKYKLLAFLEDKNKIDNRIQIEGLQGELLQLAEETDVRGLPGYAPIPVEKLLFSIGKLSNSVKFLNDKDIVKYYSDEGTVSINKNFNYDSETVEDLLTKETLSNRNEMILKVKKPDYLGESMWDFKHGDRAIQAKIIDMDWLSDFHLRKYDIRPGDSLRAVLETQIKYGFNGEVIAVHNFIVEIKEIITESNSNDKPDLFN